MEHRTAFAVALAWALVLTAACGDDDSPAGTTDAGTHDGVAGDAGAIDGAALDADGVAVDGGDGCTTIETTGAWTLERATDVSIGFAGAFAPPLDGTTSQLLVLFERYVPEPPVGSFELGTGDNANFGTCRECVAVQGLGERAFFADRGTLTTAVDPYTRRLQASLTDVRLIEVTLDPSTRESTPLPGGRCLELVDATVDETFTPEGWTCEEAAYADGAACNCECGAFDPDCNECDPFADPGCEPRPVVDCEASEICAFHPNTDPGAPIGGTTRCTEVCDWEGREACSAGVCVFGNGGLDPMDTCYDDPERIDGAVVGEDCTAGFLQKVCAVVDGFATGWCDETNRCRPVCQADAECTIDGESCRRFAGGDTGLGFCGAPPPDDG